MTRTHTIARLTVSAATYDEIRGLLGDALHRDYQLTQGVVVLDMAGIGLERSEPLQRVDPFADVTDRETESAEQARAWKAAKADFAHPHWTELFDGPEAYLAWREAQNAA